MRKQFVIFGIVCFLVCVGLSGCNQLSDTSRADKIKFLGTWIGNVTIVESTTPVTITFFPNNIYSINLVNSTWNITDGKLVLEIHDTSMQIVYSYVFSNNDKNLTISDITGRTDGISYLVLTKH